MPLYEGSVGVGWCPTEVAKGARHHAHHRLSTTCEIRTPLQKTANESCDERIDCGSLAIALLRGARSRQHACLSPQDSPMGDIHLIRFRIVLRLCRASPYLRRRNLRVDHAPHLSRRTVARGLLYSKPQAAS